LSANHVADRAIHRNHVPRGRARGSSNGPRRQHGSIRANPFARGRAAASRSCQSRQAPDLDQAHSESLCRLESTTGRRRRSRSFAFGNNRVTELHHRRIVAIKGPRRLDFVADSEPRLSCSEFTSELKPSVSDRRMNSWRCSVHSCPTAVRKRIPRATPRREIDFAGEGVEMAHERRHDLLEPRSGV